MANYQTLKSAIQQVVKTNGNNEITGALLQQSLLAMINSLGSGYQFVGVATPTTNPGNPDAKVFYIANGKGTYTNFGGIIVNENDVDILYWDNQWHKINTGIPTNDKINQYEVDSVLVGNGSTGVEKFFYTLTPGRRYRLTFVNNEWDKTGTGSDLTLTLFQIARYTGGTKTNVVNISLSQTPQKYYEFNAVECDRYRVFVRAATNENVIFKIEDVTIPTGIGYEVLFSAGAINCNNTEKRFELSRNIVYGNKIIVPQGTTLQYNWITSNSSLVFLAIDPANNTLLLDYYWNIKQEYKILAALLVYGTSAGTLRVEKIIHSSIDMLIDGVNIDTRILANENAISEIRALMDTVKKDIQINLELPNIEKGTIYLGSNASSTNAFRVKGYFAIIQNTTISFSFAERTDGNLWYYRVVEYDENKTYLRQNDTFRVATTFTVGSNTRYVRFVFRLTNNSGTGVTFDSLTDVYTNNEIGINYQYYAIASADELEELKNNVGKILPLTDSEMTGTYDGEKITLTNRYKIVNPAIVASVAYHQSMAVYGKYMITSVYSGTGTAEQGATCTGQIIDLETGEKVNISFPIGLYNRPHCNTMVFGNEFATGNTILPLLYISMWDYSNERGCLVYNINKNGDEWTVNLVQAIIPNIQSIGTDIIGNGSTDWVVDTDNNFIYAMAYYIAGSSTIVQGNKQMIVKFALPKLSDGQEITLTGSDVLDHYETECFNYGQDKTYHCGKVYIIAGGGSSYREMNRLRVLDLLQRQIVTRINLNISSEPEGLTIYNDRMLFDYGFNPFELIFG